MLPAAAGLDIHHSSEGRRLEKRISVLGYAEILRKFVGQSKPSSHHQILYLNFSQADLCMSFPDDDKRAVKKAFIPVHVD